MSPLVLITDDNPKRLERVRHLLESEGADTVTASDAREAMRLFVRREPDLALLQVDPPDELCMELCRDMKRLSVGRRRFVVVVAPRALRPAAFDAGCDAFVGRQSGYQPLLRTVRRFLASPRRPQQTEAIESSPCPPLPPGGFEGDLQVSSVVELVQTLNLGGKTARVLLRSSSGTGTIWFRDGAMTHATAGPLLGDVAVHAMIEWTTGRFLVEYGLTSESSSIAEGTTNLLLDALRRVDAPEPPCAEEPVPAPKEPPTEMVLDDGAPVFTFEGLGTSEPVEAEIVARLDGGAQAGVCEASARAVFAGRVRRLLRVTANRTIVIGSAVKVKIGSWRHLPRGLSFWGAWR